MSEAVMPHYEYVHWLYVAHKVRPNRLAKQLHASHYGYIILGADQDEYQALLDVVQAAGFRKREYRLLNRLPCFQERAETLYYQLHQNMYGQIDVLIPGLSTPVESLFWSLQAGEVRKIAPEVQLNVLT